MTDANHRARARPRRRRRTLRLESPGHDLNALLRLKTTRSA